MRDLLFNRKKPLGRFSSGFLIIEEAYTQGADIHKSKEVYDYLTERRPKLYQ